MGMSSVNAADMNATAAFIEGFLVPHNQARNAVGVGRLQWDRKLANYARNYARQRRGDCLLQHSDSPFGENIFWGSGNSWTPLQAVAAWIDEKKWFDYAKNICTGPDCTHYTQVVWRTTTNVGCAKIKCNSGDTFITCNYYPPGNYIAARPYWYLHTNTKQSWRRKYKHEYEPFEATYRILPFSHSSCSYSTAFIVSVQIFLCSNLINFIEISDYFVPLYFVFFKLIGCVEEHRDLGIYIISLNAAFLIFV